MYHPSKAGDSCDGTLVSKEIFPTEEAARRIYGLDTSVIKKNVKPASKVLHALRIAPERTTSLDPARESVVVCHHDCLWPLYLRFINSTNPLFLASPRD